MTRIFLVSLLSLFPDSTLLLLYEKSINNFILISFYNIVADVGKEFSVTVLLQNQRNADWIPSRINFE